MPDVLIRENEGCAPDSNLLWDSVWFPTDGVADWRLAGTDETLNRGGFAARAGLQTAAILCLFTDKRCPADHPLAFLMDGDPRGWWGDGIDVRTDLGETEMGSLLWLLERAPLTIRGQSVTVWAEQLAFDALSPLLAQQAVVRIDTAAVANEIANRLELTVNMFGENGTQIFAQQFELLWRQVAGI